MNKLLRSGYGYTIVELLIVITITAAIAISAFSLVNGQQARNEFSQSVRDLDSALLDIANDAGKGYFPLVTNPQACNAPKNGAVTFTPSAGVQQGRNSECVFAGKGVVINSGATTLPVETLAVRKYERGSDRTPVNDFDQLRDNDIRAYPGLAEDARLFYGLRVQDVRYNGVVDTNAHIVFASSLGGQNAEGDGTGAPITQAKVVTDFSVIGSTTAVAGYRASFPNGITICVEHGAGGRKASITFGQNGRELTTTTEFDTTLCG